MVASQEDTFKLIHFEDIPDPARVKTRLIGPSVALVGWIPNFKNFQQMPKCAFRNPLGKSLKDRRLRANIKLMFLTGNPIPNGSFETGVSFLADLQKSKEFRGLIVLDKVSAALDEIGDFVGLSLEHMGAVGYTPLFRSIGKFCTGSGYSGCERQNSRFRSSISYDMKPDSFLMVHRCHSFKIGGFANVGSRIISGEWAAYASLQANYTFWRNGEVEVSLTSSVIPSQSLLTGWTTWEHLYSMMTASQQQIEGFFWAGKDENAPVTAKKTIRDTAERIDL